MPTAHRRDTSDLGIRGTVLVARILAIDRKHASCQQVRAARGSRSINARRKSATVAPSGSSISSDSLPANSRAQRQMSLHTCTSIALATHDCIGHIHFTRLPASCSATSRHQPIGQGQDLQRVDRRLGRPLLHLHFTRAALGCAGLKRSDRAAPRSVPTRAQAGAKVLALQTIRAGHARAALLDAKHLQPADQPQQVLPGRPDASARNGKAYDSQRRR